jgi:hypothetical protein
LDVTSEKINVYETASKLIETKLSGGINDENVSFYNAGVDTYVTRLPIFSISSSSEVFSLYVHDGFIGIAPYTNTARKEDTNFMRNLEKKEIINHNVVSIYSNMKEMIGTSYIKFGSYDPTAIMEGQPFKVIKTVSLDSWAVSAKSMKVDVVRDVESSNPQVNEKKQIFAATKALIEPQLPYMYLPELEWKWFFESTIAMWNSLKGIDTAKKNHMQCTNKECYIQMTCPFVAEFLKSTNQKFVITLTVGDVDGDQYDIQVDDDDIFIPG